MFCPKCGADAQNADSYCTRCGEWLPDLNSLTRPGLFGKRTGEEKIRPREKFDGPRISLESFYGLRLLCGRHRECKEGSGNEEPRQRPIDVKDVTNLDKREEYDLITAFDAIHDQARPAKVLRGIADALKPDGVFLMTAVHRSTRV